MLVIWPVHTLTPVLEGSQIKDESPYLRAVELLYAPTKTQGEMEANLSEAINRFEREYMGRGPKKILTYLLSDLIVIRLIGVLTPSEQHLTLAQKGRDLLKEVRMHLVEQCRPQLEAMVHSITGVKVLTMHYDISTVSGEALLAFTLEALPKYRKK